MNNNQPLISPDRVLSLVVLILSLLMIMGSAFLYYTNTEISYSSAMIGKITNQTVEQIRVQRQQVNENEEGGDDESPEEIVEE